MGGIFISFGGALAVTVGPNCPGLAQSNPGLLKMVTGVLSTMFLLTATKPNDGICLCYIDNHSKLLFSHTAPWAVASATCTLPLLPICQTKYIVCGKVI